MKRINSGFTMVELIVVIVILGILSATALPRFMSLDGAAGRSVVQATAGAFKSAVIMANAAYRANGAQSTANQYGQVDVNSAGYPISTNASTAVNAANCRALWDGLMEDAPGLGSNITARDGAVDTNDWAAGSLTLDAVPDASGATGSSAVCLYKHRTGQANANMYFLYNPATGQVVIETDNTAPGPWSTT